MNTNSKDYVTQNYGVDSEPINLKKLSNDTLLAWFKMIQKNYYSCSSENNTYHKEEEEILFPYASHDNFEISQQYTSFQLVKSEMDRRNIHLFRKWEKTIIRKIKSQKKITLEKAQTLFANLKKQIFNEVVRSGVLRPNVNNVVKERLDTMY